MNENRHLSSKDNTSETPCTLGDESVLDTENLENSESVFSQCEKTCVQILLQNYKEVVLPVM